MRSWAELAAAIYPSSAPAAPADQAPTRPETNILPFPSRQAEAPVEDDPAPVEQHDQPITAEYLNQVGRHGPQTFDPENPHRPITDYDVFPELKKIAAEINDRFQRQEAEESARWSRRVVEVDRLLREGKL